MPPFSQNAPRGPRSDSGRLDRGQVLQQQAAEHFGCLLGHPVAHALEHVEAVATGHPFGGGLGGRPAERRSPVDQT